MIIRLEEKRDYLEVENLVRNAFWNLYRPGAYEHYIVHNLRNDKSFIQKLAYVIEKDNKIIGHINYSKGKLKFGNGKCEDAVVLGPISIDKDYQNKGYGSKLINHTIELIKDEIAFLFVIGDEHYYERFGFESASKYNFHLNGTDFNDECPFFMIKIFNEDEISFDEAVFFNPQVFDVDEMDVDKFDENFEFKQKKICEGQLGI